MSKFICLFWLISLALAPAPAFSQDERGKSKSLNDLTASPQSKPKASNPTGSLDNLSKGARYEYLVEQADHASGKTLKASLGSAKEHRAAHTAAKAAHLEAAEASAKFALEHPENSKEQRKYLKNRQRHIDMAKDHKDWESKLQGGQEPQK